MQRSSIEGSAGRGLVCVCVGGGGAAVVNGVVGALAPARG